MTTTYLELQVLSTGQTSRLAEMFRLLGEPNRLSLVYACLEEPQSVQTLAADIDISMSLASHHLRLLRSARLLRAERRGKQVFYVAADAHVQRVLRDMVEHSDEE
ncbi:ArsR family transcriptional regulator [Salinisphaera orenii MK-B5]|uniref:ArsR family transcriptional regulator n=2 Tax=Salinisphaera orenii TaxID=856731 RepID=A0A423PG56_9GAMM|nr:MULTISPECIES: metalloregulator ArsR/SmtB family transcription factor [Salinisphaera]ROO24466.1 ArsR family transcriptional regulator [Salinisphaera orenii MK-B5]ROO28217.1 ArsR family transcriptional regulator [Salinisphaera halophila YIM 95161]